MNWRLESVYDSMKVGYDWEEKGNIVRAYTCFEDALYSLFHLCLKDSANWQAMAVWLADMPLEEVVSKYVHFVENALDNMKSGNGRFDHIIGSYLYTAFAHWFAILDKWELADYFTDLGARPELWTDPAPLWCQYGPALRALSTGGNFTPVFGKLNRTEKYGVPYVDLMVAGMKREGIPAAIMAVDAAFAKRNKDMSNLDDPYMIDGNGYEPQHIDFRKEGILALFRRLEIDAS